MSKNLFLINELGGENAETDLFHEIFYNFPDMIHSVNEEGKIVAFNKKALTLLGYSQEELLGKDIFDIYALELSQEVKEGWSELKKKGHKTVSESKMRTKSGEVIDVEIRSLSLYNKKGEFVKTLTIIRDIRELKYLKNGLIQQAKLASIGELASGIMHDIRNPLSVIYSYSEIIDNLLAKGEYEKIKPMLGKIQLASTKIEKLTNNLREFSRVDNEPPSTFPLTELLEEALLMVESKINKSGIDVINECKDSHIMISFRFNRLEQVIMNILSNAADACAEKKRDGAIIISAKNHNGITKISIKDNGPGIKDENLEHIFTAFFTTKPKDMGTGLGLSICAGIMRDDGGEIEVKNNPDQGVEFIVTLNNQ